MPNRVEVLVIGGGVIGASIAHHLTAAGCREVIVVDAAAPGSGSTGRATGGFRAQYATEVNVQLSLLSRQALLRFDEITGISSGYEPVGYLFLTHDESMLSALHEAQKIQHGCGLTEARMVTPAEAMSINPAFADDAVAGGSFCPTDGFIKPMELLRGYREAAERAGARFQYGERVTALERQGDLVTAVTTERSRYEVSVVVNAAGPWAKEVARLAGAELPVERLKRQVAATVPTDVLSRQMAMTIWLDDGFHLRVRDGRVLLLRPADPEDAALTVEESWLQQTVRLAHARFPQLRDVAIDRGASWGGYYEMSPDRHAILGRDELENFYYANGSSGHGVMHAPAIGLLLAEMITGRSTTIDVSSLRPSRFREGAPIAAVSFL